jgi:hypothetical protein
MVFWFGILVGGLVAWFTVTIGFYETWAMLFNFVVSVYVAVFVGPMIIELFPVAGDTAYGAILAVVSVAVAVFLILESISYSFITGQLGVSFPRLFNTLGAAVLGFLCGVLLWSFVAILIYMSPISQNSAVKAVGFDAKARETTVSCLCRFCGIVHRFAASDKRDETVRDAVNKLLEGTEADVQDVSEPPAEPNEPAGNSTDKARELKGSGIFFGSASCPQPGRKSTTVLGIKQPAWQDG